MMPHGVEVFVGLEPIDLRWGIPRLSGIVAERLGRDARSGALFVFFGKRRDAVKVIFYDGTGACLFYKRLDRGAFRVPTREVDGEVVAEIDERALDDLLDGIGIEDAAATKRATPWSRLH